MSQKVGKDVITGMGFVGLEAGRLYHMRCGPKFSIATIRGNPAILPECAAQPLYGLKLYGKSTQETTTGAQLYDMTATKSSSSIIVVVSEDGYTLNMSTTVDRAGSTDTKVYRCISAYLDGFAGKTITLSYDSLESNVSGEQYAIGTMYRSVDGKLVYQSIKKSDASKSFTITLPADIQSFAVRFFMIEGTAATVPDGTYAVTLKGFMCTEGAAKKKWEPYTGGHPVPHPDYPREILTAGDSGNIKISVSDNKQPYDEQNLVVNTPNGLPGIKVVNNIPYNYVDEDGKKWLCDEIDFTAGVYRQRVKLMEFDGSDDESISINPTSGGFWRGVISNIPDAYPVGNQRVNVPISHFSYGTGNAVGIGFIYGSTQLYYYPFEALGSETVDDARAWLKDHPIKALIPLKNSKEIPLSDAQIAAYKKLMTYKGTTNVLASADVGMEVSYRCNLKAAKKEVNATYATLMAEMEGLNDSKTL